jgi:hypothetical protein
VLRGTILPASESAKLSDISSGVLKCLGDLSARVTLDLRHDYKLLGLRESLEVASRQSLQHSVTIFWLG